MRAFLIACVFLGTLGGGVSLVQPEAQLVFFAGAGATAIGFLATVMILATTPRQRITPWKPAPPKDDWK